MGEVDAKHRVRVRWFVFTAPQTKLCELPALTQPSPTGRGLVPAEAVTLYPKNPKSAVGKLPMLGNTLVIEAASTPNHLAMVAPY
jgi:hypothetical protein